MAVVYSISNFTSSLISSGMGPLMSFPLCILKTNIPSRQTSPSISSDGDRKRVRTSGGPSASPGEERERAPRTCSGRELRREMRGKEAKKGLILGFEKGNEGREREREEIHQRRGRGVPKLVFALRVLMASISSG